MNEPSASHSPDASPRGSHLDSWKEIAAYLKRDIRTVQRWEKREGLPVHRHQHDERGTAYAYSAEIDRWLDARRRKSHGDDAEVTVSADAASASESPAGSNQAADGRRRVIVALLAIATTAVLIAAVAIWRPRAGPPAPPLTTLSIVFPANQRVQDWGPDVALSPDGASLLYTPRGAIRLRRLDELEGRIVSKGFTGWGPFFSPDGRQVGFFEPGRLVKAPVAGGTPVLITQIDVDFQGGADWGPNDQIVFTAPTPEGSHGLYRVPAAGGRPQLIAMFADPTDTYWLTPQWIDDGNAVLCTVSRASPDGPRFQVVAVSAATGEQRLLIDNARHARDIGGILVYWRDGSLFAAKFDSRRLEVTGPHVAAWDNVGSRIRNRSWAQAGDTLVYWPRVRAPRQLAWMDRDGREEVLGLRPGEYKSPRLSPDGRRMAIIVEVASSEFGDLWIHDLVSGANLQLTRGGQTLTGLWTADGRHLIVSMRHGGANDLYRFQVDGRGEPEPLNYPRGFLPGAFKDPLGWSPDGNLILRQWGAVRQSTLWAVDLENNAAPRAILPDSNSGSNTLYGSGSVTVDGRWIAFSSAETGRTEVYVAPLPEGRPKWRVSSDGGALPLWARSGRELFYRSGTAMMVVPVSTNSGFTPGEPRKLFDVDMYQVDPGEPHYDVSPEDRFLVVKRGTPDGPERLNVVQGWRTEIERRLLNAR